MEVFILCASVSSPINRTICNIQRHWKEQRQCAWSIVSTRQMVAIIMAPAHSRSSTMNVQLFQKELWASPLVPDLAPIHTCSHSLTLLLTLHPPPWLRHCCPITCWHVCHPCLSNPAGATPHAAAFPPMSS